MANASPGGNAYVPVSGAAVTAESFGASSSASGAVNTAAINAALAKSGLVTITTPGTYTLAKSKTITRASNNTYDVCLVIPGNTTFRLGAGVVLQTAAGLVNPAIIQNSDTVNGNTNIAIEGPGVFDGNSDNVSRTDGTGDFCCMHLWLQNITDLRLSNLRIANPRAWGIGVSACNKVRAQNTTFVYTCAVTSNQGGFQFQGPNTDCVVRDTFGNTYDDLVAFDTHDVGIYLNTMANPGPVSDILIDGVTSDPTAGALHLVRLLDSTTNPMARVIIRNLQGPYLQGAVFIAPAVGNVPSMSHIVIDGVNCNPLTGQNPPVGTFHIYNGFDSISISNVNRTYNDVSESTRRPVFEIGGGGNANNLKISNVHIADTSAAGANVNLMSFAVVGGVVEISNITCTISQSNGSNTLVGVISNSLGRIILNNIETIRVKTLINAVGAVSQGAWISNVYMLNNHAAAIIQNGAVAFPLLSLSNVNLDGTQGGAAGCINVTGVTGTMLIQLSNCVFANGANVNLVRSASEAIRVQSMSTPVPSGILTQAVGDIFLDSSNSNNPYRCSTAPTTFTAL